MARVSGGTTYGRVGVSRTWAVVVGVGLLLLAAADAVGGSKGIKVTGHTVFMSATGLVAIYAALGIAALVSALFGEVAVKLVLRAIGVALVALVGVGIAARASMGQALGFPTKIPMAINLVNLFAAVAVLAISFAAARLTYAAD